MEPTKHRFEKGLLVFTAFMTGLAVFDLVCSPRSGISFVFAIPCAVVASFLYVLAAAAAANAVIELRSWAYCGNVTRPSDDEIILVIGAFWPFALFFGGLVYVFIGTINRIFK